MCDPIAGLPCWPPWVTLLRSDSGVNTLRNVSCIRVLLPITMIGCGVKSHDVSFFCAMVVSCIKDHRLFFLSAYSVLCCRFVDTVRITGKFPGYLSPSAGLKFADVPNGLAAISKVPAAGWGQILAYMAFCEVSQDQSAGTPAAAGDFGFKVLTSSDPAEKTKKLSAELANGRLAMMAIIGMFFQVG